MTITPFVGRGEQIGGLYRKKTIPNWIVTSQPPTTVHRESTSRRRFRENNRNYNRKLIRVVKKLDWDLRRSSQYCCWWVSVLQVTQNTTTQLVNRIIAYNHSASAGYIPSIEDNFQNQNARLLQRCVRIAAVVCEDCCSGVRGLLQRCARIAAAVREDCCSGVRGLLQRYARIAAVVCEWCFSLMMISQSTSLPPRDKLLYELMKQTWNCQSDPVNLLSHTHFHFMKVNFLLFSSIILGKEIIIHF